MVTRSGDLQSCYLDVNYTQQPGYTNIETCSCMAPSLPPLAPNEIIMWGGGLAP